jgi:filamentous hemagglutinin family protein
MMKNQPSASRPATSAEPAPQIELLPPSLTMRVGNRRLTLCRRVRQPMPRLLSGLLRRSWRSLFGASLRISLAAAAVCAAWNAPVLAAEPAGGTLPTGGTITNGNATFIQSGNTLTVNQTSSQAIANFNSFSIGANATVNISQPNAAASFLARVTGTDPSLIYGLLKSNGTVALINQNGILIGPTGVVDVARFIASTLNISDSDFLAGRLTFTNQGNAGSVDNQGSITSASGGSVYLIGANVSNSGVIHSPNGEILLAAGQTVQLVDTGTPGVTVNVTGATGNVINLGNLTAEAGRIGIAAGLINNSGNINASSVVSDGGRIFLRASQNLTTSASSSITADGAVNGGSVVLYSDGAAYIDGAVSALGGSGIGGYVETSGLTSLDVVKAPTVGIGGTWYIDPYDLTVEADTVSDNNTVNTTSCSTNVIQSNGSASTIRASEISSLLTAGTNVTLATSNGSGGSDAGGGNITVNAAIIASGNHNTSLTLNANNNIYLNADITSTTGTLNLQLNTNTSGVVVGDHAVVLNHSAISLNGGTLTLRDGTDDNRGNLSIINAGVLNLSGNIVVCGTSTQGGSLYVGNLTVDATSTIVGAPSLYGTVEVDGTLNNSGLVTLNNTSLSAGELINRGTLTLANSSLNTDLFTNSGVASLSYMTGLLDTGILNSGTLSLSQMNDFTIGSLTNESTGTVTLNQIDSGYLVISSIDNAGLFNATNSSIEVEGNISNTGIFNLTNSSVSTGQGGGIETEGFVEMGPTGFTNEGTVNANYGVIFNGAVTNYGVMNFNSSAAGFNGISANTLSTGMDNWGRVNVIGQLVNSGTINNYANFSFASGSSLSGNNDFYNSGTLSMTNATLLVSKFENQYGSTLSGTGTININNGTGILYNDGVLAPGGDGVVGTLSINGGFVQQEDGSLLIDIASSASYDQIKITNSTYTLDGTLQTKLLGSYIPAINNTTLTPIMVTGDFDSISGYFRHVYGDVINSSGSLAMVKARYGSGGLTLQMLGSEDITFTGGVEGGWGSSSSWSTGYLPTAVDNIIVNSGTLSHGPDDGLDIVNNVSIGSDAVLNVSGGTLQLNNLTSTGSVLLSNYYGEGSGGALTISGTAQLNFLVMSGGTTITGETGSVLNVTGSFNQSDGVIFSDGDVVLSQTRSYLESYDLHVGNITARNLVLESSDGSITQSTDGAGLVVTKQLITASRTGTTLENTGNYIAAYAGTNSDSGDITLINHLNTNVTSAVAYNGVTNKATGGNVNITNYGAAVTTALSSDASSTVTAQARTLGVSTTGLVSAADGSVSLVTHSPLTIGSAGVTASGGIILKAGDGTSATDTLIVNGVIASTNGDITLFGNSLTINANVSTSAPGQALFTVTNGVITYAPGVSITDVNGTVIPVALALAVLVPGTQSGSASDSSSSSVTTQQVTQATTSASNTVVNSVTDSTRSANNTTTSSTTTSTTTTITTSSGTMTTGGEPGTFGGDDPASDSGTSNGTASSTTKKAVCN